MQRVSISGSGKGSYVFAVVHGSQPKFTIPEILEDMHRAVRYIRARAAAYKRDPDRIGITGGSADGHLSLMQGTAGDPERKRCSAWPLPGPPPQRAVAPWRHPRGGRCHPRLP